MKMQHRDLTSEVEQIQAPRSRPSLELRTVAPVQFDLFIRRSLSVAKHLGREMLEVEPHPGAVEEILHGCEELHRVVVPEQREDLSQLTPTE